MKYFLGILFVFALVFGLVLRRPSFPSDVTQFLPVDSDSAQAAKDLANSGLSRRVIILIDGPKRKEITKKMKVSFEDSQLFLSTQIGPPKDPTSIHRLYFPRRYDFARSSQAELEDLNTSDGMEKAAQNFIVSMGGKYATMMRRLGPEDPFLTYVGVLERLRSLLRPELKVVDQMYETSTKESVLFAEIKDSPFDANNAKAIDDTIRDIFSKYANADSNIRVSGVHRHTLKISSAIKWDIRKIGLVGLLGLGLIFGLVFGRFRFVLLPLLSISIGGLFAFAITSLVFGEIHLIALAIGASLIGVCVDYSIHFLNHPGNKSSVWPAIRVGAITTIGGFVVLFASSVSALHQIALFASIGVLGTVIATWIITQKYFNGPPSKRHLGVIAYVGKNLGKVRAKKYWGLVFTLPIVILSVIGLPFLDIEKDLHSLRMPLPQVELDDHVVRSRVSRSGASNIIIVRAKTAEKALQINDELAEILNLAKKDGLIDQYSSLNKVLWSAKNQEMNRDFFARHQDSLIQKMTTQFEKSGVQTEKLSALKAGFPHPNDYLSLKELRASDLGELIALFDPNQEGRILLTYLGRVDDAPKLEKRISKIDGAFWFQKTKTLNTAWQHLGTEIIRAIGIGLLLITLIAILSFRERWGVIATLGPPVFGCFATLGLLTFLNISIGPIHGLALILVIAIAADYGVMLVAHQDHFAPLALSILMAYASTMFSFGALAISSHPVLHTFGLTIAAGVTFSLLLLPGFDRLLTRFRDPV